MDTGLLNLGEEHFSTCYVFEEYEGQDTTNSDDNNRSYFNEWEDEKELNGDIGLIPESSSFCQTLKDIDDIASSPPSVLFQKMLDWSGYIYVDGVAELAHDSSVAHSLSFQEDLGVDLDKKPFPTISNDPTINESNFDITKFINEPDTTQNKPQNKFRAPVKKIDLEAQKYIVDEKTDTSATSDDVIDVETVFEGASLPVLEATDAFSLLEQFEASEKPITGNKSKNIEIGYLDDLGLEANEFSSSPGEIFEKIPEAPVDIFEEDDSSESSKETQIVEVKQEKSDEVESVAKPQTAEVTASHQNYVKSKQILDALPQELIARINESGKRKPITVIPPIPNKKRGASRSLDSGNLLRNKIAKVANDQVQFDHDYCASVSPYPKEPQKDSGFQSSEEDDRTIIRNQPTVKTADGKLMVSLLKVNTIRTTNSNSINQKKKLNLEEYKKRRFISSTATSRNTSPSSSTCSSPLPEDENLKRIRHHEKLMKMAADLLNTPPKKPDGSAKTPKPEELPVVVKVPEKIVPPPDLEVKTYVSIGTNTEISTIASDDHLKVIKPLLQKVSDKINSNSFITSLIENIPKVKSIAKASSFVEPENQAVVREDKIIHYLQKDRLPVETKTVESQTDFEQDDDLESRYRRRMDRSTSPSSSSSRSSCSSYRRRRSSSASRHSHSSRRSGSSSSRSSRVSSRSRSRSISPKRPSRHYSAERLREVEERRVIYVGRIVKGIVKDDLRRRFQTFGPITNISLHFRDYGDNYGFVTFANKEDAYEAVEHGNDGIYPKYDLSFGGRRIFCKTSYSDLDNVREYDYNYYNSRSEDDSFDALLRAAQEKIRKRKP